MRDTKYICAIISILLVAHFLGHVQITACGFAFNRNTPPWRPPGLRRAPPSWRSSRCCPGISAPEHWSLWRCTLQQLAPWWERWCSAAPHQGWRSPTQAQTLPAQELCLRACLFIGKQRKTFWNAVQWKLKMDICYWISPGIASPFQYIFFCFVVPNEQPRHPKLP